MFIPWGNWNRCRSRTFCPDLNTSTCLSHDFSFRFRDCTCVMKATASEVEAVSTEWASSSFLALLRTVNTSDISELRRVPNLARISLCTESYFKFTLYCT